MKRREFISGALGCVFAAKLIGTKSILADDAPQISFTFDDFNLFDTPILSAEQRNRAILEAFRGHSNLKSAIFVAGKYISDETKREHLRTWSNAGHIIGNHSYSHLFYPDASFEAFSCDVLRGEAVVKDFRQFKKIFRFPF